MANKQWYLGLWLAANLYAVAASAKSLVKEGGVAISS
jgi:hypothetical protein